MMKICVGAYVRLCMDGGGITDIRCLFKLLFSAGFIVVREDCILGDNKEDG